MHTKIIKTVTSLPVIREFLGAGLGCVSALALYGVFEFLRGSFSIATVGLLAMLVLAAGCAFLHRRFLPSTMSEID